MAEYCHVAKSVPGLITGNSYRWKQQEKLASSNTAPLRNFHRRMSPAIAAKLETWPIPDADENPSEIIKRNSKVLPASDSNLNKSGNGGEVEKPCLARISHLQVEL